MRYLAVDLGDQRTGLALGDAVLRIASPLDVLELPRSREDGAALINAIAREAGSVGASALVLGLPLNMDGSEGPRTSIVRSIGHRLEKATRLPVLYHDERLSTARADWQMARSGMTRGDKKARRDALAAAAILQDFLASLPPAAG